MSEDTFKIIDKDDKTTIATGLSLDIAIILVEALFNKWHSMPGLSLTIVREEKITCQM